MAGWLSGPGQPLPIPSLYPASLVNGAIDPAGTRVTLAPGQAILVPRGVWAIDLSKVGVIQVLDPITQTWQIESSYNRGGNNTVTSDGTNIRVANMTGCAIGGIVTTAGSSYVAGSTTATPSAGNSQWTAVVGGLISTTVSVSAAGAGYTVPPLVFIPPPPQPGVQATAIAVLSSGTVSSITVVNQGAGYQTAPVPQIYPNPTDPAYLSGAITSNATAVTTLVGAGTLAAVLCTNPGSSFSTVPSLTIAGAGSSAAATIVPMWTITGDSITNGGAGYSTLAEITTVGGVPSATPAYLNPAVELTGYLPRKASIGIAAVSGGTITTIGTIYDGGLFAGTPTAYVAGGGSTSATIALTLGSAHATIFMAQVGG
jgi:hypothetical protein